MDRQLFGKQCCQEKSEEIMLFQQKSVDSLELIALIFCLLITSRSANRYFMTGPKNGIHRPDAQIGGESKVYLFSATQPR